MIASTRRLALAFLLAAAPAPALAADAPVLKAAVTVASDLVRLGDLLDGAGPASTVAVFRAPDLGTTGTVQVGRILAAAQANGLPSPSTQGLAEVTVTRASRALGLDEIRAAIADAIARQGRLAPDSTLTVAFDPGTKGLQIEPDRAAPLAVTQIAWSPATGRFDATLAVEGSAVTARAPLRIGGSATETVTAPVYTRVLRPGDVIGAADVALERIPRLQAADAVEGLAPAIGQAVRKSVRAGQAVVAADLTKPTIVARNDAVTLVYEAPGILLTIRAKALEAGAEGDTVPVLNLQSSRVLQATVTGPGRVAVGRPAPRLALN